MMTFPLYWSGFKRTCQYKNNSKTMETKHEIVTCVICRIECCLHYYFITRSFASNPTYRFEDENIFIFNGSE